jgi:hypothetical protein
MHPRLSSPQFKLCTNKVKASSEFEFRLNRIAREYQRRSHLNLIPKKKQGDFCTQPLCYDCGEALHAKRPCPNKSIPNLDHLNMKACSHCGEEGHQASQCTGNCPNYDIKHPTGECPSSDMTCFLCESSTHGPANCSMNHLVTAISKIKQNSFQPAAQVVKTSKEYDIHRKQQKARNKKKQERRIRRQENKPPTPSDLCYDLNLRSG